MRPPTLRLIACSVIFAIFLAVFLANGRLVSSGDNLGTRATAVSIATNGSLDVHEAVGPDPPNYSVLRVGDRLLNSFPLGTGVLAVPIYGVASAVSGLSARELFMDSRLEKAAAALLSALSVAIFYFAASKRYGEWSAVAGAGLLALGTPVLTTMGQGLWSHTGELLAVSLAYWASSRHEKWGWPELSGLSMAMAFFCRPTALLLVGLPLLQLPDARKVLRFMTIATVGCLGVVGLNFTLYGRALGGYGLLNTGSDHLRPELIAENLPSVLLSPSKGLLWFFPVLLFCLAYLLTSKSPRATRIESSVLATTLGLVVLLTSAFPKWWGGHSVGPRLLAELSIPCAIALTSFLAKAPSRRMRTCAGLLASIQVAAFLLLNFSSRADQWSLEVAVDANPRVLRSWKDGQIWSLLQPNWKYEEHGNYFDADVVASARARLAWTQLDLSDVANARYDLPGPGTGAAGEVLFLERLRDQPPPPTSHFQILPPGRGNVLRVCRGEVSPTLDAKGGKVKKLDTLILWRGQSGDLPDDQLVGNLILEFTNGQINVRPLRFGHEIVLRRKLDLRDKYHTTQFYAGTISAPDSLQRQRFSIPGKNRALSTFRLESPAGGPAGCLNLLAVSLGTPEG